ncbi:MAG: TIGR02646 family protein [Dehalococcoidia bacterium]|nr:TIGR02646 family protein [Dehalococcoidia bacterium]
MRKRFHGKCGYCERRCGNEEGHQGSRSPTVDHFRPRSQYPELTYEWTNWIFSCRQCNVEYKQDKWPSSGYVDPCASEMAERPERYFDYDHSTGELVPKPGLPFDAQDKARNTVEDLGLNERDLRFSRIRWIERFRDELSEHAQSEWLTIVDGYVDAAEEYCGITRMFLAQYQRFAR